MPLLAVNVDHVATIRQARQTIEPDPVTAAHLAELAGARAIIVHLREDRRHIQDRDVELIARTVKTRLHLEMAATEEMEGIARKTKPHMVCLVPEKREELTTEGGLDVVGQQARLTDYIARIKGDGIKVSLFIDPDQAQVDAAVAVKADYIELHTGAYADAPTPEDATGEFNKLVTASTYARTLGLRVNLGHGLNYDNIYAFSKTHGISEYSIGHSIVSRAVLTGFVEAVKTMADIIAGFCD
ncbi:pyridoxine 5'-phosphate synthase [Desulfovibrio inopinatus]|uniref:pyridoxine 5'-phosphate synthase n=1 Tax=Desulfovibrio inopinatus TaxID=102109 RepID=UPI0003F7DD43|nr:pyridoxine 5'-phosphate synthase [Desulfovibrio inopinatus]